MPTNDDTAMKRKRAYRELEERFARIKDLQAGLAILGWDQEVVMPPGGAEMRANTIAALTSVVHELLADRKLARLVERLHAERDAFQGAKRRTIALARRAVRKATAIPSSLAAEIARTESRGLEAWREARAKSDFSLYAPVLEHMVGLKREVARLTAKPGKKGSPYDALLDEYEPGATVARIDPLLRELSRLTTELVQRIKRSRVRIDTSSLTGPFDPDAQREFAKDVVLAMGVDLARGRLDVSTHPFCGGVGPGDVRMTGRYHPKDLRPGCSARSTRPDMRSTSRASTRRARAARSAAPCRWPCTRANRGCGRTRSRAAVRSGSTGCRGW